MMNNALGDVNPPRPCPCCGQKRCGQDYTDVLRLTPFEREWLKNVLKKGDVG